MKTKHFYTFALIILAFAGIGLMAATTAQDEKVVTVDKTIHDFGTIAPTDGPQSAVFVVTNNTDAPVLITSVRASCGCTASEWTKTPIEPGKTGTVTAKYNPANQAGPFTKTVTIETTSTPDRIVVRIKGVVQ